MPINGRGYGGAKARARAAAALGAQPKAKPMKAMKAMKAMKEAPKLAHFKENKIKDPEWRAKCEIPSSQRLGLQDPRVNSQASRTLESWVDPAVGSLLTNQNV